MMKRFLFFALLSITIFSCEYDNTLNYSETQCADPWDHSNNSVEHKNNIKQYLLQYGIETGSIEIIYQSPGIVCEACNCPSGRTISITVTDDDKAKAIALGFTE